MVECQSSKLIMRVRFPLPAPNLIRKVNMGYRTSHTRKGYTRKTKSGKTVRVTSHYVKRSYSKPRKKS